MDSVALTDKLDGAEAAVVAFIGRSWVLIPEGSSEARDESLTEPDFTEDVCAANSVVLLAEESSVLISGEITMDSVALTDKLDGAEAAVVAFIGRSWVLIPEESSEARDESLTEPDFTEDVCAANSVVLLAEKSSVLISGEFTMDSVALTDKLDGTEAAVVTFIGNS